MRKASRQEFERRVKELESFGHRGSATDNEDRAADYLLEELKKAGLSGTKEPFMGSNSAGARFVVHVALAAFGAAMLWSMPILTVLCGVTAFVSFVVEQGTRTALLGRFLINSPSRNVVARIPPPSGQPQRRIVVVGHYDTQRTGLMWRERLVRRLAPLYAKSPGFTKSPFFVVMLTMATQSVVGLARLVWPDLPATTGLGVAFLVIYGVALLVLTDWATGPFVPGASDNATGAAAAIALAEAWSEEPLPGVEFVLLLSGCEESGLLGTTAWCEANARQIREVPTRFLNIDSLGYGAPRYLGQEYSLAGVPIDYPSEILSLCSEVAAKHDLENAGPRVLPVASDGLPFLVRGIPGASVLCFEQNNHMPNYHQLTDTSDRLDFDVAWKAVEFCLALLDRLAAPQVQTRSARET